MGLRLEHVRDELGDYWYAVKDSFTKRDWKNPREWAHFYVDIPVETLRALPYTLGHIIAIGLPIFVVFFDLKITIGS